MSLWQEIHEPYVWTWLDGKPYSIVTFNRSKSGVYVLYGGHHLSIHSDGKCHDKAEKWTPNKKHRPDQFPKLGFTIPPLTDVESRFFSAFWASLYPALAPDDAIPLDRAPDPSKSVFLDPADFQGYESVIETFLYKERRREEVQVSVVLGLGHRPMLDLVRSREYPLGNGNLLGVFVYRANHGISLGSSDNDAEKLEEA